jgi:homopolymeric O-antigen transport system ATP-binding protein
MKDTVIEIDNVSKLYQLGEIGTGTLSHDIHRWWALMRGKEDPYSKVRENDISDSEYLDDYIWALKEFNLEIHRGEIVGIIGRNGAGKSTLLKLISSITSPSTGQIKINGRIASLLEVGTGMHPEMTASENIYMNGSILGMNKNEIDQKFDEIIEFAGCKRHVNTPLKRFSSGMKVRLGFSVAAFLEPEILIVDEVLAVGDMEFQQRAIRKLREITEVGERTVLIVSHNLETIQHLCDRGILIEKGKCTYDGEVETTISKYVSDITGVDKDGFDYGEQRQGIGDIRVTDVILENVEKNNLNIFPIGARLRFRIFYKCKRAIKGLQLVIFVRDQMGQGIVRFDTAVTPNCDFDSEIKGEGEINCETDSFNLKPGKYYVNVLLFVNEIVHDELINPISFEIHSSNYFGSGKLFDPTVRLKAYIKHSWSLVS